MGKVLIGTIRPGGSNVGGAKGSVMGSVVALTLCEGRRRDDAVIAALYHELGAQEAERIVTRATCELAVAVEQVARALGARSLTDVPGKLRRVRVLAEGLGLATLARVAGDARVCLARGDDTAFGAVWMRLRRIVANLPAGDGVTRGPPS